MTPLTVRFEYLEIWEQASEEGYVLQRSILIVLPTRSVKCVVLNTDQCAINFPQSLS